jgi:hypothetical protein
VIVSVKNYTNTAIDPLAAERMAVSVLRSTAADQELVFDFAGTRYGASSFFNALVLALVGVRWSATNCSPMQARLLAEAKNCLDKA